jgi:hypothetical protein
MSDGEASASTGLLDEYTANVKAIAAANNPDVAVKVENL